MLVLKININKIDDHNNETCCRLASTEPRV